MSPSEFALKCRGCGLRWIIFGNKPGKVCVFCGGDLVKARRRG